MFTLFTDTDTDITPEIAKLYGYKLISMPYTIGEDITFPYEDFEVFDCHGYYDILRGGVLPTTSALSPEKYISYFEPELKAGKDILYVHFSRSMSGTFNSLNIALQELSEKYPERKVHLIDTKGITVCSYIIVRAIGDLLLNGATLEDVMKWAETEVDHYATYFFADDLKFFKKSGRVSGLAAFFGGLIGIKPIIHMSQEGKMVSVAKAKGRKSAVEALVKYVDELGDDIKNHRVIICHTDAPELVEQLSASLKAKYGEDLDIEVIPANPTAGAHCGPNAVGVAFHAIHR
ncbi:MAG: DegV family protein [Bacilli bacterium]|nr:DegV family protein [Bacilli bacterium]